MPTVSYYAIGTYKTQICIADEMLTDTPNFEDNYVVDLCNSSQVKELNQWGQIVNIRWRAFISIKLMPLKSIYSSERANNWCYVDGLRYEKWWTKIGIN